MRAALFLLVKLAILVAIAVWLADRPGSVEVVWQGYVIQFSFGLLVLGIAVLMAVSALLYWIWRSLTRAPAEFSKGRTLTRRERGYQALTGGMVAIAAGDADTARRAARRADNLLEDTALPLLLSAQAALLSGDEAEAHRHFETMAAKPDPYTEFLGLRGLLTEAMRKEDWLGAYRLAARARELRPETPWLIRACFELEVRLRKWVEAQSTLAQAVRTQVIPKGEAGYFGAAIRTERSREAESSGDLTLATELAHEAGKLHPSFVPAIAREATLLGRDGKARQGARVIEKAWATTPHPDLAAAYRQLGPEGEDAVGRVKRMEKLYKLNPDHPEGLIALAEAEMEAQLWGAARSHLMRVEAGAGGQPATRRVYRLLAELETSENDDSAAARDWLKRAAAAPDDPAWVCDVCGTVTPVWSALCGSCGSFATERWRSPVVGTHLPNQGPALLPELA